MHSEQSCLRIMERERETDGQLLESGTQPPCKMRKTENEKGLRKMKSIIHDCPPTPVPQETPTQSSGRAAVNKSSHRKLKKEYQSFLTFHGEDRLWLGKLDRCQSCDFSPRPSSVRVAGDYMAKTRLKESGSDPPKLSPHSDNLTLFSYRPIMGYSRNTYDTSGVHPG